MLTVIDYGSRPSATVTISHAARDLCLPTVVTAFHPQRV